MAFTPKQERNGADVGGTAGHNTAQPGPDATGQISGLVSQAQAAAERWKNAGEALFTGGPAAAAGDFTAGGNMWDWDSGIAVAEQPGEM